MGTKTESQAPSLFELVVELAKVDARFDMIRSGPGPDPGRAMLDEIFQDFHDKDGNFVEQFQTTGFDTRFFELYLFAYFSRSGFTIDSSHNRPDYMVSRDGVEVVVEATTTGRSGSSSLPDRDNDREPPMDRDYLEHELPIRLGSALFSKLRKRYWELEHVQRKPLVFAIEPFHDKFSLLDSAAPLIRYLYGLHPTAAFDESGVIDFGVQVVDDHQLGSKRIPSDFFGQQETENISAVLYTNSGTQGKFTRMGYQAGFGRDSYQVIREGQALDAHPQAMDPVYFRYDLDRPMFHETWGDGLIVIHNPNARYPVPRDFFVDAVQFYLSDGNVVSDYPRTGINPIMSRTYSIHHEGVKPDRPSEWTLVQAIPKDVFRELLAFDPRDDRYTQDGWFADSTGKFLGVVLRDEVGSNWAYAVFRGDTSGEFAAIGMTTDIDDRHECRFFLQRAICKLLRGA